LASGMVNTSFMMGGALGLAVLASLAAARTQTQLLLGMDEAHALNAGYHLAFAAGAGFAIIAALLGAVWFARTKAPAASPSGGHIA
jgi:hypothetical protein